jgi:quinolinate synthase
MAGVEEVKKIKEKYPGGWVVSYINTNADVKAVSDVCCTSANAAKVVKNLPADRIIFLPDKNLCWNVKNKVRDKEIICWQGYCSVHRKFTIKDVQDSRKEHPDALLVVHPECDPEIQKEADSIESTSGMLEVAKNSGAKEFIIGTEEGMLYRLKKENPDKEFYSLGSKKICTDMKKITLQKLKESLEEEKYEITLPEKIIKDSEKTLKRMLEYS